MGIQIKGQNDNITSTDGSLEITGITTFNTQLDIGTVVKLGSAGIVTASNFKTGISNLHDVGLTLTGGQLDVGSNIKIGSAGVVTATSFVGNLIGNISGDFSVDDKIIHTGDTNTAIRFPAVDTFTVETNNTERFRIGSNGYIGVGNFSSKSRTDPLNVDSGIGTCNIGGNYIHLKRYSGGATQYINAPENNANLHISADDFIAFGVDHSSSMYSMGTEALRITSAGNVTVGGHTAALSTYNSSQPRLSVYKSSGSGGYLELGGNIPHNGHSSGTILFINNDNSDATNNNANGKILAMQRVENSTSDTNAGDDMGGDLTFNIKPESGSLTERLRIKADGSTFLQTSNVNINRGTSGAGYPLTVRGPADGDTIRIERANSYQWHIGQDSNSNLYFKANATKEVVFPTGGGIAFNGETSASNSLNDYEYGNWNATVQWNGGNTTGSYAHTTAVTGTYVKVGHVVHAWITVYPNSYNSGSDCVIVGITLPTSANQQGAVAFAPYSGQGNYNGWLSVTTYPRTYAKIDTGNNRIQLLVTGNNQGAGFWGHKGGAVAANAQVTVTYYDT